MYVAGRETEAEESAQRGNGRRGPRSSPATPTSLVTSPRARSLVHTAPEGRASWQDHAVSAERGHGGAWAGSRAQLAVALPVCHRGSAHAPTDRTGPALRGHGRRVAGGLCCAHSGQVGHTGSCTATQTNHKACVSRSQAPRVDRPRCESRAGRLDRDGGRFGWITWLHTR